MSASQQKKKRQESGESVKKQSEQKPRNTGAILAAAFVVVVAVAAVFFGLTGSGFFQKHTTAAMAGSHKISPAIYNIFYQETSAGSSGAETDLLIEQTNSRIAETYAVYDEALRNGYALTEADKSAIDAEISNLDMYASYAGAANAAGYLTAAYGVGVDLKRYREYAELRTIADSYTEQYKNGLSFTDAEIDGYYENHRDEIDTVSYRSFTCQNETDAEAFRGAAEGSETAFAEQARVYADDPSSYESDDATLRSDMTLMYLPDNLKDWLTDPARVYGEVTTVDNGDETYTVAQFVDNWTKYDGQDTVDVRHILIKTDESTTAEQAKARADEILSGYLAGEQTEDAFAQLAVENSADGNASSGGLYEDVTPGMMVQTFNDWCFDPSRQPGDTGVVETEYGAHVMYFSGKGENVLRAKALEGLRSDAATVWSSGLAQSVTVETKDFGMGFTNAK